LPPSCGEVSYEGKVYETVQIGSQCWFRENLNVGIRIDRGQEQTNNQLIEKYCYRDDEANCDIYGGLYQWDEMMQYNNQQGGEGICPLGWHVPSDQDWKDLESFLGIPNNQLNKRGPRGTVEGEMLKELGDNHWISEGGSDDFGFTALPSGMRTYGGDFSALGSIALVWTSTMNGQNIVHRSLHHEKSTIQRDSYISSFKPGFSVRCIKN